MNIWILDYDPCVAAQHVCDQHIDTALKDIEYMLDVILKGDDIYVSHPCIEWLHLPTARGWVMQYTSELNKIYKSKFGKDHKASKRISECLVELGFSIKRAPIYWPFSYPVEPLEMYDDVEIDEIYREYYRDLKVKMTWENRVTPNFMKEEGKRI